MTTDPYRVREEEEMSPEAILGMSAAERRDARFEERAVAIVLFLAGTVGVGIGVSSPTESSLELSLGALFAVLGVATCFSERTSPGAMKKAAVDGLPRGSS